MATKVNYNGLTFPAWVRKVNIALESAIGLSHTDLPEWDYLNSWYDGDSPQYAAQKAIENVCSDDWHNTEITDILAHISI